MKNLLIIASLFVGVLVGYLIPRHQEFDFANKNIDKATLDIIAANPTILKRILSEHNFSFKSLEEPISKDEAMKLIEGFKIQNRLDMANGGGLFGQGPENNDSVQELGGFVISDTTIQKIYKNDGSEKCTGLRIYLAKRPNTTALSRLFTFVVVGTKAAGTKGTGGDIETPIVEHVDPCPKNCGQLRP